MTVRPTSGNRFYLFVAFLLLAGCAALSPHRFAEAGVTWQTRTGQLMYRNAKTSVVGDVVVRYSNNGDFELTFSKGPGVALLNLRQDSAFAEVRGAMAGRGWSGPVQQAPPQLRGWLELRDAITRSPDRHQVRQTSGSGTFIFRF